VGARGGFSKSHRWKGAAFFEPSQPSTGLQTLVRQSAWKEGGDDPDCMGKGGEESTRVFLNRGVGRKQRTNLPALKLFIEPRGRGGEREKWGRGRRGLGSCMWGAD